MIIWHGDNFLLVLLILLSSLEETMAKILLTEDEPTIRGALSGHEVRIFTAMAGMFDTGMQRQRTTKVWKWNQPEPWLFNYPRPEAWKNRVKKNRRKKRARKSTRGY